MHVKRIKIGNVTVENNVFLAPMAGITDAAFRGMCKKFGAGLVYTEMASSKAIHYNDKKTEELIKTTKSEKPIAIQLFGNTPEIIKEAVEKVQDKADIIDINMGCPAPKITKNKEGSYLLKDPKLIGEIIKAAKGVAKVPITIKIRKGWDDNTINALEVAKIAEESGVDLIAIHPRTTKQFYTGHSDWQIIKEIKEVVSIPVIGNGDITDANEAKKMFDLTGCDGIMIGRASIGRPWIFKEIIDYLSYGETFKLRHNELLPTILEHLELVTKNKGESIGIKQFRKQLIWYVKGLPNASIMKNELNKIEDKVTLEKTLKEYLSNL